MQVNSDGKKLTVVRRESCYIHVSPLALFRLSHEISHSWNQTWQFRLRPAGSIYLGSHADQLKIAVVTLRTFALGKLDLLTVLPRETSI